MFDLLILIISSHLIRYYKEGSRCEKCHQSCELCTGPGPESCRACPPPLLELQGTKLCVEHCPHRFYQLDDVCKQCHTSCQSCIGRWSIYIVESNQGFVMLFDSDISDSNRLTVLLPIVYLLITRQQLSCEITCVCRCLASELPDMWLGQHAEGKCLLSTMWGRAILFSRGTWLEGPTTYIVFSHPASYCVKSMQKLRPFQMFPYLWFCLCPDSAGISHKTYSVNNVFVMSVICCCCSNEVNCFSWKCEMLNEIISKDIFLFFKKLPLVVTQFIMNI